MLCDEIIAGEKYEQKWLIPKRSQQVNSCYQREVVPFDEDWHQFTYA